MMSIRRQRKSSTEYTQIVSAKKSDKNNLSNICFPLMERSKDCSPIVMKQKQNDYSGYKQINANRSKNIQFQQDLNKINRY